MGVEASQIRFLRKILMKNSYNPALVYFCPGLPMKSSNFLGQPTFSGSFLTYMELSIYFAFSILATLPKDFSERY